LDFREAERRFDIIDGRYRAGEISQQQYRTMLQQIQVTDGAGRLWMMQESTGQWYVYVNGGWQAAVPPTQHVAQRPVKRGGASPWVVAGGVLMALLACGAVILAALFFAPQLGYRIPALDLPIEIGPTPAPPGAPETGGAPEAEETEGPLPTISLTAQETLPVPADDSPVRDGKGTELKVPKGALPEGGQAQMAVYQPQGELYEALTGAYEFETPFYEATAQGADDGVGRVSLRLPAASTESRILAVIDERLLVILDVEPEGGVLTLNPRLGPSEAAGAGMIGSIDPSGSVHYAVIHPRGAAGAGKAVPGRAAMALQGADARRCGPEVDPAALKSGSAFVSACRKNAEGSVFVSYPSYVGMSTDQIDQVVDAVEVMIKAYADLEFTAAKISRSSPMHVEVFKGGGDPRYKVRSGVIAIPADVAKDIGAASSDLRHEMAHWVQDEEYVMTWAFYWDDKVWWLETAAENMVMLADEGYVGKNLTTYGLITLPSNELAFQAAPYDWPADSYVQAQLVKVNICDDTSVCPLSQSSFIAAINAGTYPFDDSGAREKLSGNLDDYARYLLGKAPARANSAIQLSAPVKSGEGYGEYVQVVQTTGGDFTLNKNGSEPQMKPDTSGAMNALIIDAALQKDGVYPLRIESGLSGGRLTGLPAALRISPGAPLWYRIGDDDPKFHEGREELVIQPIHGRIGLPSVRLVALGREGGERFQARVEMVDLSGAWVLSPGNQVSNGLVCSGDSDEEDREQLADFGPTAIGLGSVLGDYTLDAGRNSLTWSMVPDRKPADMEGLAFTYQGIALMGPQSVKVQAEFDLPRSSESGKGRPRALLAALALGGAAPLALLVGPGGGERRNGRWRVAPLLALLGLVAFVLAGCLVGFEVFGSSTGDIEFTQLEYVGGEETAVMGDDATSTGDPLWRLGGGQGTFQVDMTFVAISEDEEGNEVESTGNCSGPVVYKMEGMIYKDVVVELSE
jgi:hypothetical protein